MELYWPMAPDETVVSVPGAVRNTSHGTLMMSILTIITGPLIDSVA